MDDDQNSLNLRRQEWMDVVNRRDVARYAKMLVEDVIWIPPGQDAIVGRDAFAAWVAPYFHQFSYGFSIHDVRMRMAGDHAVERARFATVMTPAAGGPSMTHGGSYFALWHRGHDALWRIERYADVTDLVDGNASGPATR